MADAQAQIRRKRVMVVDDDVDLRRGLTRLLSPDFEVFEAADALLALKALAEFDPDLMLLDMSMPGMTGIEALKLVRQQRRAMPVLMLTAQADVEIAKQALDLGANAYITKPFDFGQLRGEVKRILQEPPHDEEGKDYRPWRVAGA